MADPTSEENSSFPYLNPHIIFWVFLSRFHKNALQLLKGSYTFWTLIFNHRHHWSYNVIRLWKMPQKMSPPDKTAGWVRVRQRKYSESSSCLTKVLTKERWSRGDNRPNMGLLRADRWEEEEEEEYEEEKQKQEARGGEDATLEMTTNVMLLLHKSCIFTHPGSQTVQLAKLQSYSFYFVENQKKKKKKQLLSQFVKQSRYQELHNRTKSAINVKEIS